MGLVGGVYQYDDSEEVSPLKAYMNRLGDSIRTKLAAENVAWAAPTLSGSWVNYGSTFQPVRYCLQRGIVHVQGAIKSGTGAVFTLPAGMRPGATIGFACLANGGIADVRIDSAGVVTVPSYYAGGTNAIVILSLTFVPGA